MKKKALALAVASALIAPSAFAASDTSGMQYTSASEGFYGSLRANYVTSSVKDGGANIEEASSRIGIGGTADLGGGLTGFYGWELQVPISDANDNGKGLRTRLGNVGLRGDFGQVIFGSFWTFDYSATHGATDQGNVHSGFFNYTLDREGRSEKSVQYTTPDFNGFQSALLFKFDSEAGSNPTARDATGNLTAAINGSVPTNNIVNRLVALDPAAGKDENDLDAWNLAASYAVQGFTLGASYNVRPDALAKTTFTPHATPATGSGSYTVAATDAKSWTIRGSYGQDNWNVNAWYGSDNTSDKGVKGSGTATQVARGTDLTAAPALAYNANTAKQEDSTFLALHAGVAVDKVNLYAIHEINSDVGGSAEEDTYTTLGVQYNLGSQARTWLEYTAQDYDSDANKEDYVNIGLRFDF